jgi:hypothetical protein
MQRCALQHLLPLVGQAASTAAGMPEVLLAALTSSPRQHPAARLTRLVGLAAGEFLSTAEPREDPTSPADPALTTALTAARKAADKASRTSAGQR